MLYQWLRYPILNYYFPYFKPTSVYFNYDRDILQFNPACARYDDELTYLLRPGTFKFCNREYCNDYSANKMGLRDDENSLKQPKIIVLGDSYALGWGVNQNETFAQVIESTTGRKVLNSGISSFGTARELMLLERLDTSQMEYLVIQYSNNDIDENISFLENGFHLKIMPQEKYNILCEQHMSRKRYRPFLFTYFLLERIRNFIAQKLHTNVKKEGMVLSVGLTKNSLQTKFSMNDTLKAYEEAKIFLEILARKNLHDVTVIVLNISHYSLETSSFINQLFRLKQSNRYPLYIQQIQLIDASSFLEESDYFLIDDHLNASGHQKVAEAIINELNKN